MSHQKYQILHWAFVFLASLWAGGTLEAQEYYFRNFSGKDGLAQSQVYALLEDSRGVIWMGTWGGGISRYDGRQFSNLTENQNLLSNYVYSLCEDEDQNIWIGTDKGLCRYNGQKFTTWPSQKHLLVYDLCMGENKQLWVATHRGLYYRSGGAILPYVSNNPILDKADIRVCYTDVHGFLWLGSTKGVFVISPSGNVKHFTEKEGWNGYLPYSFVEDVAGAIWLATEGGGIQCSDGRRLWSTLSKTEGLSSDRVVSLHRTATGEIWAGTTDAGINIWNPIDSTLRYLQEKDGLESNDIRCVIQDSWGNHWVGTSGGGVSKYSGQQFSLYDESDGLVDKEIYGIDEDTLGQIWLSTSRGISLFDGARFHHFGSDSAWISTKSRAVLADEKGRIWAGFDNKGLGLYDRDTFRLFTADEGVGRGLIRDIVADTFGNIWVATTTDGITKVSANPRDTIGSGYYFQQYNRQSYFPANYIYALLLDQQQGLWFATRYQGIGYIDALGQVKSFDLRNGLPDIEVRTLAMDSMGQVWGGTARGGIFRCRLQADSLAVKVFGTAAGLTSNNIYQMVFDVQGQLWVGHERGVDRLLLDEAQDIAEVKTFGYREGFKGGETCNNAVICDSEGDLWFGTMNGLMHYRAGINLINTVAPKVHLQEIHLFYKPLMDTEYSQWVDSWGGLQRGLQLPYRQNSLGFFFQGINHSNSGKVSYEWQLEGYEEKWSPLSPNNSVNYSNLPPGSYVFKVRAYNEDLVTNEVPIRATFTILTPFWQKWWFRLSSVSLFFLLIALLFRSRLDQVRRKAKEEKERLEIDKQILQLEQKALQLQMNPHFIFNALNSIQQLISTKDHQKARYQLAKFSKLMRATLENSRESRISLAEEIQSLQNYLALEQFSRDHSFDYEINLADDLDPDEIGIPPMMIQPFVENAIIHGVAHLSDRKGKISLYFAKENQQLRCEVTDNGIGREKANQLKSQQEAQHKSTALQVTKERLTLLDPNREVSQTLIVEDIYSLSGKIAGTKVIAYLPFQIFLSQSEK